MWYRTLTAEDAEEKTVLPKQSYPVDDKSAPLSFSQDKANQLLKLWESAFNQAGYGIKLIGSLSRQSMGHDMDILILAPVNQSLEEQLERFYNNISPKLQEITSIGETPMEAAWHPDTWFIPCVLDDDEAVEFYFTGKSSPS